MPRKRTPKKSRGDAPITKKRPRNTRKKPPKFTHLINICLLMIVFIAVGYLIFHFTMVYLDYTFKSKNKPSVSVTSSSGDTPSSPSVAEMSPSPEQTPDEKITPPTPHQEVKQATVAESGNQTPERSDDVPIVRPQTSEPPLQVAEQDTSATLDTPTQTSPPSRQLPKICIIVDDFGTIGTNLFNKFNTLDPAVAFAVIPDLPNSRVQMEQAVIKGREVIIHIPMQPENPRERIEPNTILTEMDDETIKTQIDRWVADLRYAKGANNHMGSLATADERVMRAVLSALQQHDLFFVDSLTSSRSVVRRVASALGVKTIARDIFLDVPNTSTATAVNYFNQIKNTQKDTILIITHCHSDGKYRQLSNFIDRLKNAGYQLIPPSQAVKNF